MSLTRTLYRARVVQRMDVNTSTSTRWDTTAGTSGEIDPAMSYVFDREWRRILTHQPYQRVSQKTPTSDSSGRYALSDLAVTTTDAEERLFRVLSVVINGRAYQEVDAKDWFSALADNPTSRVYWRQGSYLNALPTQASTAIASPDGIWVNHLPSRPDALSADSATVVFPDGYDEIVILETAALLLAKGGAETGTTQSFKALADEMRRDMLDDLSRTSARPRSFAYSDSRQDWGG